MHYAPLAVKADPSVSGIVFHITVLPQQMINYMMGFLQLKGFAAGTKFTTDDSVLCIFQADKLRIMTVLPAVSKVKSASASILHLPFDPLADMLTSCDCRDNTDITAVMQQYLDRKVNSCYSFVNCNHFTLY